MIEIDIPQSMVDLYDAQQKLQDAYSHTRLKFTLDGRLIGDMGEALVSESFGVELSLSRVPGVDGKAPDGRSVQIKATQFSNKGPAFTPGEGVAQHLIFLRLDFRCRKARVIYNGPEPPVRKILGDRFSGTKSIPLAKVLVENAAVRDMDRLWPLDHCV